MWPDNFDSWWGHVEPVIAQRTYDRLMLYRLMNRDCQARQHTQALAGQAVCAVYDLADARRGLTGYFPDRSTFLLWAAECAWREALRLLLPHECVRPWLEARDSHGPVLPGPVRSLLFWLYLDQFTERQLARVRGIAPAAARHEALAAYGALCDLLRANGWGQDDDLYTFPLPPALVGFA
jgi:hypothetical protein